MRTDAEVKALIEQDRIRGLGYGKKYRDNPENKTKIRARGIVNKRILAGTMLREACWCGEEKSEAHHPDYSKPLEVEWLCKKHHTLASIANR